MENAMLIVNVIMPLHLGKSGVMLMIVRDLTNIFIGNFIILMGGFLDEITRIWKIIIISKNFFQTLNCKWQRSRSVVESHDDGCHGQAGAAAKLAGPCRVFTGL